MGAPSFFIIYAVRRYNSQNLASRMAAAELDCPREDLKAHFFDTWLYFFF